MIKIIPISSRKEFLKIVQEHHLHHSRPLHSGILKYRKTLRNMRLALLDGHYVGCACSCRKYSCLVYVLPYYRRRGIGKMLVQGLNLSKVDQRPVLARFWKKAGGTKWMI